MANYQLYLYDDIGNSYERKNLFLKEVAELEEKIDSTDGENKKKYEEALKELYKQKNEHPYIKSLNQFFEKEEAFLKDLKVQEKKFKEEYKTKYSKRVASLKVQLRVSEMKLKFYEQYKDLTYDSTMYQIDSSIRVEQLEQIISEVLENEQALVKAKAALENIDNDKEKRVEAELKAFKLEQKNILNKEYSKLKGKKKEGLISDKALKNGYIELKKQYKEAITVKSFDSEKKSAKENIGTIKYRLKTGTKRELTVMESNIADYRRKTPVETEKVKPKLALATILLPGLGQFLNGQKSKAIFFFILSAFVYVAAIPYALGFGNYQGSGVSGLMSLAENGRKIDRSLIFMIEGIMAVLLVIFAIIIIIASYKDVLKVEKESIRGVRPRNWFETKTSVQEDGFPYMVSLPALVAIAFIVLVPITTAILLSFTNMDPDHQNKFNWVGLQNYKLIALGEGVAGGPFWNILGWTLIWTACATTLAIVIGFGLAILSNNERIKFKGFFRSVYILPWAVPAFITIMFFSVMFSPRGILTEILNNVLNTDALLVVKQNAFWSRVTLILLQGWLGSAYVFLLSTGVLQAIPADLYEAAQIDGASSWQKLRKITLPIVLFQTAPLLVGQYTFNFNNFSIIYLFNSGGPFNPTKYGNLAGSTDLLISYIYKLTTQNDYQAIGAAITIVISLGLMLFAFIGFKNSKAFKEEKL